MKETWKAINEVGNGLDYSELYLISNLGNVWSKRKNKVMSSYLHKDGYSMIDLFHAQGNRATRSVHRLVALAFIPNPNNYDCVLHKRAISDGGTNDVDNLYWGDKQQNAIDRANDGNDNSAVIPRKRVELYNIDTLETIKQFESVRAAAREFGIGPNTVSRVVNGLRPCTRGKLYFRFY